MAHRRVDRSPTQASQEAGLEGEESLEEADRQEVARQEEVACPQEKEVANKYNYSGKVEPPGRDDLLLRRRGYSSMSERPIGRPNQSQAFLRLDDQVLVAELRPTCAGKRSRDAIDAAATSSRDSKSEKRPLTSSEDGDDS